MMKLELTDPSRAKEMSQKMMRKRSSASTAQWL
jgi:hypothetical protein